MNGRENVRVGILGELKALRFLRKKGMHFLALRYRGAGGEIDLVMQEKDTCVFVEVKYRGAGHIGDGVGAVDHDKRRRIRKAAAHFMAARGNKQAPVRFDVVELSRAGIWHIRNAF